MTQSLPVENVTPDTPGIISGPFQQETKQDTAYYQPDTRILCVCAYLGMGVGKI